jgi:hypothetical protein
MRYLDHLPAVFKDDPFLGWLVICGKRYPA